jgi:hypothetical protein
MLDEKPAGAMRWSLTPFPLTIASTWLASPHSLATSLSRVLALVRTHQTRAAHRKALKLHRRRSEQVAASAQAELDGPSDDDDPFRREIACLPMLSKGVPAAPPGLDEFSHLLALLVEQEEALSEGEEWVPQPVPVRGVSERRFRREVEEWEWNRYAC